MSVFAMCAHSSDNILFISRFIPLCRVFLCMYVWAVAAICVIPIRSVRTSNHTYLPYLKRTFRATTMRYQTSSSAHTHIITSCAWFRKYLDITYIQTRRTHMMLINRAVVYWWQKILYISYTNQCSGQSSALSWC